MTSNALPELVDARQIRAETGQSRAFVEALMRALPTVQLPGLRKVLVRRSDVERYIEQHTTAKT